MSRYLFAGLAGYFRTQLAWMVFGRDPDSLPCTISGEAVGPLKSPIQNARKLLASETIGVVPCGICDMQDVLEEVNTDCIDLHAAPNMLDSLAWGIPIECVSSSSSISQHSGQIRVGQFLFKRIFDIVFSCLVLILLSPFLLAVAIAIKLDSRGPVLYSSERIGKLGSFFRCLKFRTMVYDAEMRRAEVIAMNERDGVLFKITDDPRVTSLGRILRKYSIDELPQFLNVLLGDMSVVGPRPSLLSEVREYKRDHLRRLDVAPGITGLWQVQARQDPSFDSYVSLDLAYIEWWSLWLDIKIIMRTVGTVLSGTGC